MSIKTFSFLSVLLFLLPHCGKSPENDSQRLSGSPAGSRFISRNGQNSKKLAMDYYKMSVLEIEEGDGSEHSYRKALQHLDRAVAHDANPRYLAQRATVLFLLGKTLESKRCFEKALKHHRTRHKVNASIRAEIMNNYACVLAKTGQRKEALSIFEDLQGDKNYLTPEVALVNQARIFYEDGALQEARQRLNYATKLAPDYIDASYYLALVCYAEKDYPSSLRAIDKTLRLEAAHDGAVELRKLCCDKLVIC